MTTHVETTVTKTVVCTLHYKKVRSSVDLSALSEVFSHQQSPSILGGNPAKKNADGFSYWAAMPKQIFQFNSNQQNPFKALQKVLSQYKLDISKNLLPAGMFCGGWIGYLAYELAGFIEKLPQTTIDDLKMPLIHLCFYDRLICYDHQRDTFWLLALQLPEDSETPQQKLAYLEKFLSQAQQTTVKTPQPTDLADIDFSQINSNMTKQYYLKAIEKIKRYIYDGDVYQINFTQRFESQFNAKPIDLFSWQNHYNPCSYSAYIDTDDFAIVSTSPEMFITIENGTISTKPIKGTRPRINQANSTAKKTNAKNFDELVKSEKDQAELNMIIDLERNDLGRICEYGTIKVVQPRTIETYPTVFHAVATISGRLRNAISFSDILKAMFPGGSITGAPKVSSMKIIDQLEPTDRGVYTGAIGFIDIDGNVCLNIAIRTIIIKDKTAYVQVGGGIVADSDPQAEWDETITKARALLAGINTVNADE